MPQSTPPALPNMGQDLTPLGTFVPLNPGFADHPEWTATHAVTSVVSPLGDTLLVLTSGFNRVYNNPLTKLPLLAVVGSQGLGRARVRLRPYDAPRHP